MVTCGWCIYLLLYPSLMDDINKNRTDAGEFAQLFNLQSWPDMPDDPYDVKEVV